MQTPTICSVIPTNYGFKELYNWSAGLFTNNSENWSSRLLNTSYGARGLLITLFRVASSSLRLRSRNRLMSVDGFFATIRARPWLSSASALSRSADVNLSAASRLAVSFFAFCWAVIGMSPDVYMWRELNRVSILSINQKSVSPKPKFACGCSCLRPMRRPISSKCLR